MIFSRDYHVWIGRTRRLDGLTSRYGADPYIEVVLNDSDGTRVAFNLTPDLARKLARGLTKAAKETRP